MEDNLHNETFVDVILPLSVPLYTYRVPETMVDSIKVGCRVVVQLGLRKMYTAIIYGIHHDKPNSPLLKDIESVLDENPKVTQSQLDLWDWMSDYYMCTRGEIMKAALPSGLKLESETHLLINPDFDCMTLSESDRIVFAQIEANEQITVNDLTRLLNRKSVANQVHKLINLDAIIASETISEQYKPKTQQFVHLARSVDDKQFIDDAFKKLSRATKQQELFLFIVGECVQHKDDEDFVLSKQTLLKNWAPNILAELEKKNIILVENRVVSRFSYSEKQHKSLAELSEKQTIALSEIQKVFTEKDVCLLHGVTSSGKTELYMHLIHSMLQQGKQVLYLLPEIALTSQIINRLQNVFGNSVGIYHSKFSDNERVEVWNNLLKNDENSYKIILGVRSSIFLPFSNLGLIVVDEEHETSFKQYDPSPRYNARDMAYILGKRFSAKVLLGTATPSFETYYNSLRKSIGLVELKERHTKAPLPEIHLIDLRAERKHKRMHDDVFSKTLLEEIQKYLDEKKQIILFQNRRGFSPYLECPDCGYVHQCINCDVSLTYHKFSNSLMCHHCGYAIRYTITCPACNCNEMKLIGFGTEKIEDTLKELFPNAKIARMDLDTTRGKSAYSDLIQQFEQREIDILVGTQMITKGLDFENVGMVGVLSADGMLRFPDFRAFERAFQLMVQVAGRAGRSETQGHVFIQTYQPEHPVLDYIKRNDYSSLLTSQMIERKNFWYPPFTRLIRVTVKHRDKNTAVDVAKIMAINFKKIQGIYVLGPEFPPIPRVQLLYAQDILLKIPRTMNFAEVRRQVRGYMNTIIDNEKYKSVTFAINVDPY